MATALIAGACTAAAMAGFLVARDQGARLASKRRRDCARKAAGVSDVAEGTACVTKGLSAKAIALATKASIRLSSDLSNAASPETRGKQHAGPRQKSKKAAAEAKFERKAALAGVKGVISYEGYRSTRLRLSIAGLLAGALLGAALSNELALMLGAAGFLAGFVAVGRALSQEGKARDALLEKELPEMLEVVALGLRSGLSFDRAFELYHSHFDTFFGRCCASAQRRWAYGISTREESLRMLAGQFDNAMFRRVVDQIARSLRFGSSLAESLENMAAETRAIHRSHQEEKVAKAPVKMMIPTGTLILPAMLILILGPILLELAAGV